MRNRPAEDAEDRELTVPRNKPPIDAAEAAGLIAEFFYELTRESGLPIVLAFEDRRVIEGIVRRVR